MTEVQVNKKYLDFIDSLVNQISEVLPEDINRLQQGYLTNNIRHSTTLLAKSMEEDDVFKKLNFDTQKQYIQIMAEWSFHKEIDLFRSGIPAKHWKTVMQKIWYTTWEVMYACIQNEAPEDVVLNLIERYVNRTYQDAVEELKETNMIDEKTEEKAKEQSNIDIMAVEYRKERNKKRLKRRILRILLVICISFTVTSLVLFFKIIGVIITLLGIILFNIFMFEKDNN